MSSKLRGAQTSGGVIRGCVLEGQPDSARRSPQASGAGIPTTSNNELDTGSFMQRRNKRIRNKQPLWRAPRGFTKRAVPCLGYLRRNQGVWHWRRREAKAQKRRHWRTLPVLVHSASGRNWVLGIEALICAWDWSGLSDEMESRQLRSGGGDCATLAGCLSSAPRAVWSACVGSNRNRRK